MLASAFSFAQTLEVQAQDSYCYTPGQPVVISDFVTINGTDSEILDGIQLTITNFDNSADLLTYNGTNSSIRSEFFSSTGTLEIIGTLSIQEYRQIITEIVFSTTDFETRKSVNITLSGEDFLLSTGHFYKFFPSPQITWSDAKAAAESKELFGLQGYLTTITTQEENDFILERVSGTAWIGASDEAQEGTWRWVTGPEGEINGGQGMLLSAGFRNWDTTTNPNDPEPNNLGDEDYAHMMNWTTPPGLWNDLPNGGGGGNYEPTGYIVEYGGQSGDPDVLSSISGTTVLDPQRDVEVTGSISVCPNINGVPYTATALDGYTYNWTVDGGTIASGQGTNEIIVNWGDTNPSAKVTVEAVSDFECTTVVTYAVKINEQLEPPIPEGPNFVCYTDLVNEQTYFTPVTPGSDYDWHITNGTITSGDGTNEITVLWDGSGTGTLYFTESTRTATDICDGDSPLLTIDLRDEIVVDMSLTHVSCYQGSDGTAVATITSSNGTNNSFTWQTNGLGNPNGNSISDLPAGNYSVDVTVDDCTINVPFTITEPTELTATFSNQNDALCFGEPNGTITVNATGGTAPYTYNWSHNTSANDATVIDLPEGDHSVIVTDANGCTWSDSFYIGEPDLLVIEEIYTYKVSCPGGSDGALEAVVSGGTAPYTFTWEANTETSAYATGYSQGTYQVTVTDVNGCQATGSQIVEEAIPRIMFPNAFSPNGDNENDTFGPADACPVTFQMSIFNRWGNIVYTTTDATAGWDGTFEGSPAPDGNYTYTAAWVIEANEMVISEEKRGEFQLIR